MSEPDKSDILTAIVLALLARSNGTIVISMAEMEEVWNRPFKYEMVDNAILIEFDDKRPTS